MQIAYGILGESNQKTSDIAHAETAADVIDTNPNQKRSEWYFC